MLRIYYLYLRKSVYRDKNNRMVYDIDMLRKFYALYPERVEKSPQEVGQGDDAGRKNIVCSFI